MRNCCGLSLVLWIFDVFVEVLGDSLDVARGKRTNCLERHSLLLLSVLMYLFHAVIIFQVF